MFHYVRPAATNILPHSHFFSLENFCRFLDANLERLSRIKPAGFIDAISNKKPIPDDAYLLSFDDGLYEHYQWVFPELVKRNLSGFFFINTQPIKGQMMLVHKVHLLSGLMGYDKLQKIFLDHIGTNASFSKEIFADPLAVEAYPYDSFTVAGFKYALNYLMPKQQLHKIMDELIDEYPELKAMVAKFYIGIQEVSEMHDYGMEFGYHGHTHFPFSSLDKTQLNAELDESDIFYKTALSKSPISLSYPYGDTSSVSEDNFNVLRSRGVRIAFMADDCNPVSDLTLPRVDCREILKIPGLF